MQKLITVNPQCTCTRVSVLGSVFCVCVSLSVYYSCFSVHLNLQPTILMGLF